MLKLRVSVRAAAKLVELVHLIHTFAVTLPGFLSPQSSVWLDVKRGDMWKLSPKTNLVIAFSFYSLAESDSRLFYFVLLFVFSVC